MPAWAILLLAAPAVADDWRQKLREGSQAGVAPPEMVEPGSAFAYAGSFRGGYTSNANEDFDPLASATSQSAHELEIRHKDGDRLFGLHLHGSIDAAHAADVVDYAGFGAEASVAWKGPADGTVSLSAGYAFEHDSGFRSHDAGMGTTYRRPVDGWNAFTTLTLNAIAHEDQSIFGLTLDRGDSDRLRAGFEHGYELPALGGLTPSLSAGAVGVRHVRALDNAGYDRDSSAAFARVGLAVSDKGRLSGEAGVMVFRRDYADSRFRDRTVLLPEAEVTMKMSERTALTFSYLADLEETPFYGASNQETRTAALTLTHRFSELIGLSAVVFDERDSYLETGYGEWNRGAGLELTRKISDWLAFSVGGEFERAGVTGINETADTWKVSVGLATAFAKER